MSSAGLLFAAFSLLSGTFAHAEPIVEHLDFPMWINEAGREIGYISSQSDPNGVCLHLKKLGVSTHPDHKMKPGKIKEKQQLAKIDATGDRARVVLVRSDRIIEKLACLIQAE